MRIGARVSFDRVDQLEERYKDVDFPIELALPWKYYQLWLPMETSLGRVLEFFQNAGLNILSIHATQGYITEDNFQDWGKKTIEFAESLGVQNITVHPNKLRQKTSREFYQQKALDMIEQLQNGCKARFSIETFMHHKRVFRPMELVEMDIPMTLDVAHIYEENMIWSILTKNWKNIPVVHLSAKGETGHHLPIDDFCIRVVEYLAGLNWQGIVVLEYLFEFHKQLPDDIAKLHRIIGH